MFKNKLKNNIKRNFKKQNGFSLMETLVAIFILLLALTGPMVFAQYGLRSAFLSRDQITAFFLAQDAIEYVKNIRNGNTVEIINSPAGDVNDWLNHGDQSLFDKCKDGCSIDTRDESVNPDDDGLGKVETCNTNTIGCVEDESYTPLNFYQDTGGRSYFTTAQANGGTIKPSIFAREIKITPVQYDSPTAPNGIDIEAEITVTVRWKSHEGIGVREIKVKEYITNWAHALLN